METILGAIADAFTLSNILFIGFGVMLGILVGAIPGLNGPMAITLAVPITFFMPTVTAIGFLIGINKGGCYGGSISAILLNTPGSPEAAATCFDGHALARQGQGAKALKMALSASVFGDTFSTLLLIFIAAPIAKIALKLGPPEICAIIIFSLTIIAALESSSLAKGIVAAALGMFFSTVGLDPVSAMPRLTLDLYQLETGITLVAIGVGLLALSEIMAQCELLQTGGESQSGSVSLSGNRAENRLTMKEFMQALPTMFRSSLIGAGIGALPGIGATVAAFLAYGTTKKLSKNQEEFGKGKLEGVAAPESANNAVIGAALVPLFTLGIPGNVASALLIGAFIIHGITPGPLMFEEHPGTIYGIYASMMIGNALILALGYIGMRFFIKVLGAPKNILYPILIFVCMTGAYLADNTVFSIGVMIIFAFVGYFFKKLHFSFVTFIIGFVLGPMFELSLQQTLIMSNMDLSIMFRRPFACAFMVLTILAIIRVAWQQIRKFGQPQSVDDKHEQTDLS